MRTLVFLCVTLALSGWAHAHGGGLDANGCHTNRRTGDYHCHRSGGAAPAAGHAHASHMDAARPSGPVFAPPERTPPPRATPNAFMSSPSTSPADRSGHRSSGAFANCAEARAAGAAPVYRGQPGYGRHLDRDNDGVGCEPYRGR